MQYIDALRDDPLAAQEAARTYAQRTASMAGGWGDVDGLVHFSAFCDVFGGSF